VVEELARRSAFPTVTVLAEDRPARLAAGRNLLISYDSTCPRGRYSRCQLMIDGFRGRRSRRRLLNHLYNPAALALLPMQPAVLVVHEDWAMCLALPQLRSMLGSTRLVLFVHNGVSRALSAREINRCLRACDLVVAVSHAALHRLVMKVGRLPCAATVIHNGAPAQFPTPVSSTVDARPTVLFAGRVVPAKGAHRLLCAAMGLDRLGGLTVVGIDRPSDGLTARAYQRSLTILGRRCRVPVRFVPFTDAHGVAAEMAAASIGVVPTRRWESGSLVLLEMLASGLAVVASDLPGNREVGGDAIQYFRTTAELRAILAELSRDPGVRDRWAGRALDASRRVSWESSAAAFDDMVAGLLS